MTVVELLNKYTDEQILSRYFQKYPDQVKSRDGYEEALKEMRVTKPKKPKKPFVLFCGLYGCSAFYEGDDTRYGISQDWGILLSGNFKRATLDSLCNFLYEATYHGYSNKKVQNFWKSIYKSVEKSRKSINSGNKE